MIPLTEGWAHAMRERGVSTLVGLAIGLWWILGWWFERTTDSSDEALGVAALLLLGVVLVTERRVGRATFGWPAVAAVALYAVVFPWAPNLVRALLAATAIGIVVSRHRGLGSWHFGTWGVVAMTLPLLASLRFFLGYPLRWITTHATAALLRMGGLLVEPRGLTLVWGDVEVWVDGPCSGVQMLWVGVGLAAALAFLFRLRNGATLALAAAALVATVAGNVARASGVFYMEAGIVPAPAAAHDVIGLVAFLVVAIGVASTAWWLRRWRVEPSRDRDRDSDGDPARRSSLVVTCLVIAAAALVPVLTPDSSADPAPFTFSGWPTTLGAEVLHRRPIEERERPYLVGFPGEVAAFRTDSGKEVLLRWVHTPTRRLHSAADCYRGLGFEVEPLKGESGWANFRVTRGEETFVVREQLRDADGETFAEVGEWYWAAKLGASAGPWESVVVVEKVQGAPRT